MVTPHPSTPASSAVTHPRRMPNSRRATTVMTIAATVPPTIRAAMPGNVAETS